MPHNDAAAPPESNATEIATFGLGCFWCGEAIFSRLPGVQSVRSGFMGGHVPNPTYNRVCDGDTGHAEVIQIVFQPDRVSFDDLLDVFWHAHDPTTLNRQGADVGTQYRSVIFYHGETQRRQAKMSLAAYQASGEVGDPIVTEISPASEFYDAGDYHRDYYNRNRSAPYCRFVIAPKLRKLGLDP